MKKANSHGAVLAGLLVALVMAVASSGAWAEEEEKADPMQFARGAKAWAEHCNRCHNVRDPKELQDYEWHVSVTHMRLVAGLPGNVARDVMAFLKASN
jgi:hypothetical protein